MSETLRSRIEALFQVAELMASVDNMDRLLDGIIEHVQRVMHAEAASLYVRVPGTDFLEIIGSRGTVAAKLHRTKLKFGEGIGGEVARTKETINVPDAYQDPRFSSSFDKQTGFRTKQLMSMPMVFRGSVVGVITVMNKIGDIPFDGEDIQVLKLFCTQAAIAVRNGQERARHEKRLQTTSLFSRDVTDILGREVTVTTGYLTQLERHVKKIVGTTAPEETPRFHKTVTALETSVEQIRRLAVTLRSVVQSFDPTPPEYFSWADFLSTFYRESKYHQCKAFVLAEPSSKLFASKSSLLFVIESLIQVVSQHESEAASDTKIPETCLVLRERSDTLDFCVCVKGGLIAPSDKHPDITNRDGVSLVGIESAVELLNGELIGHDTLSFYSVNEILLDEYLPFSPEGRVRETASGDAEAESMKVQVVWQLSLNKATSEGQEDLVGG